MVDFSTFRMRDVADIALQRTATLSHWPVVGSPSYRAWAYGFEWPLLTEARLRRGAILQGAWAAAAVEWESIRNLLPAGAAALCDIGCGHAMIDLVASQDHPDLEITLVDIERTESKHHDFHKDGAGYASLECARRFLEANGVRSERIATVNPNRDPLPTGPFDMIISIISAGFHYPIDTYVDFALQTLKPGAPLVFDMRMNTGQLDALKDFSEVKVIRTDSKSQRVAAFK